MKRSKIANASDIGKTAFCPHGHYLSLNHAPDKASKARMKQGNIKHDKLTKSVKPGMSLKLLFILALITLFIYFNFR